jgi:hypothetical protein
MQEGKEAISHKSSAAELKAFFEQAVPDYDQENVYVSDIKKVINWYNTLLKNNLLDFTEEETKEASDDTPAEDARDEQSDAPETKE